MRELKAGRDLYEKNCRALPELILAILSYLFFAYPGGCFSSALTAADSHRKPEPTWGRAGTHYNRLDASIH
ncbi:protein of unknown function [Paraburkholderia dioscoreae]|uniref:Uncharacterized protein n=1 Tax=Paraburkholderia dioscoreae TaxID=2604047 RepID=A0A5Q4ZPT0_9BURK|nr:protein of unknown function [Paraburkholderia dioscoreae]